MDGKYAQINGSSGNKDYKDVLDWVYVSKKGSRFRTPKVRECLEVY
jgi:hypothetical protein